MKFTNLRSLAVSHHPEWMSRGYGRLRWQGSDASRQGRKEAGDPARLHMHIEDNRQALQQELNALRQKCRFDDLRLHSIPVRFSEWMKFLESQDAEFRDVLRSATRNRRKLSERLQANPKMAGTSRVYPVPSAERGHAPHWAHLGQGCFCFVGPSQANVVVFAASVGPCVYACSLYSTMQEKVFELVTRPYSMHKFQPISKVLHEAFIPDSWVTVVYALEWRPTYFRLDRVGIEVLGAELVARRPGNVSVAAASR